MVLGRTPSLRGQGSRLEAAGAAQACSALSLGLPSTKMASEACPAQRAAQLRWTCAGGLSFCLAWSGVALCVCTQA